MSQMLYRNDGKHGGEPLSIKGVDMTYKVFDEDAVEGARVEGWADLGDVLNPPKKRGRPPKKAAKPEAEPAAQAEAEPAAAEQSAPDEVDSNDASE